MLKNLGSNYLPILLSVPLSPVFRFNKRTPSFNFQKARWDEFAYYLDSHRPSTEEYFSFTLSSTADLCTSLTPNVAQMAGAFSQPGQLVRFSEMSDRNRTCQPGRVTPHPDVQPGPTTRQTPFSRQGNVPLSGHTVNKFRRPAVLQLNIEGLNASTMNLLHHIAVQYEALVIFLRETLCTCADKLTIPDFALAGSSLSKKHSFATFVHDRLKWTLVD